jgi:hypothetical protein
MQSTTKAKDTQTGQPRQLASKLSPDMSSFKSSAMALSRFVQSSQRNLQSSFNSTLSGRSKAQTKQQP